MSTIDFIHTLDELDRAMKDKLRGMIIEGKEIVPKFYSPDVDFIDAETPAIIFYRSAENPDATRYTEDKVRDNAVYDDAGNLLQYDVREAPEPWSITYNIRIISEFKSDLPKMARHIKLKFPQRFSYITVKGVDYDVDFLSHSLPGANYKDFGKTEKGKKEFAEQYLVRVNILMDMSERKTAKLVQEVVVNADTNN
jgi:hypothetical protein